MKKVLVVLSLFATGSLFANSEWFVVDLTGQGEAPYYLKPNDTLPLSWDYQKARTSEPKKAVAGHRPIGADKIGEIENKASSWIQGEEGQSVSTTSATAPMSKPKSPVDVYVMATPVEQEEQVKATQTNIRLEQLPSYVQEQKGTDALSIQVMAEEVKASEVLTTTVPAIAPDANLKVSKKGVPSFSLTKKVSKKVKTKSGKTKTKTIRIAVKEIPALDVGREAQISSSDFSVPELETLNAKLAPLKALKSPSTVKMSTIKKMQKMKIAKVKDNRKFDLKELVKADALVKKIQETGYVVTQDVQMNIKDIHKLNMEEMQFMQAEILYAKGDQCHAATGIYYRLLDGKNPNYRSIAKLKVGICAHKMGLFTESVRRLLSVLDEPVESSKKEALGVLLSDLPLDHQVKIGKKLENFRDYHLLADKDKDAFNYVISKSLSARDKFADALKYAEKVQKSSKYYTRAQYIASVSEYLLGNKKFAHKRQEAIAKHISETNKKDPVGSLVAVSKARMNFQRRKYKDAIKEFLKIDRNHPMWIEGLQQQAWAQMMVKDEPGAIGNMHSIHTPFFRSVYKPESYVIRGLGYINLCQYADAYKSVKNLEYTYKPRLKKIASFNKKNKKKVFNYYKTAAKYLVNTKQKTVNGLPSLAIREAVRQRDFLNQQEAINKTYDETEQYNFLASIIDKDRRSFQRLRTKAKKRKKALKAKIASIKQNKKLRKHKVEWSTQLGVEEFLISYYDFRIANYKYSKKGMLKFSKDSKTSLRNRRNTIKMQASNTLRKRFKRMEKDLSRMLQNNELLKYEIFAGAGDNLRYRITGGKVVGKRMPTTSELKKEAFNWEFDGEFWEDEVGHYRSSLKNVCPETTASR